MFGSLLGFRAVVKPQEGLGGVAWLYKGPFGQLLRYFHALAGLEGSRITSGPLGHNFKDW